MAALLALAALFAPLFLKSLAYTVYFYPRRQASWPGPPGKNSAPGCAISTLRGRGSPGSVLVLYFFMVFLSTALLLLAGNGGFG